MRILLVNSERGVAGGLSSATELAGGLAAAGHDVSFICHPDSELRSRLAASSGVTVEAVAIRAELNLWRSVEISRILERLRPDVVVADRRKDVKLAFVARLIQGRCALVHRHGAPSPLRGGPIYRTVWTRLDGLIVNSTTMQALLLQRTPWLSSVPIDVIHNGKDLSYWSPSPGTREATRVALGIAADAFVACYHGVLQPRKRVDLLVRAAATMPGTRIHLLVVGPGPDLESLRRLAGSLNVNATFTGPRSDLPVLLGAADVAVHLSVAEGFSNSVIEAMACGLPVIASNASSHVEQVDAGVTGLLVRPEDDTAVAAALSGLMTDQASARSMGAVGRRAAQDRFDLHRMIAEYEAALGRAIERAVARR